MEQDQPTEPGDGGGNGAARTEEGPLGRMELMDDTYEIRQSLIRNKYNIYDSSGNLVLKAKQKLFKMKEDFAFTDPDGNDVFRVKAKKVLDIAGDYAVLDAASGDLITTLHKEFKWGRHSWTVKDAASGEEIASITSRSYFVDLLRMLSGLFSLLPHKYTIDASDGRELGVLEGKFRLRDVYELRIEDAGPLPKEALVISAIAIDALEGH